MYFSWTFQRPLLSVKLTNFQIGEVATWEKLSRQFKTAVLLEREWSLDFWVYLFPPSHELFLSKCGGWNKEISVPCPRSGRYLVTLWGLQLISVALLTRFGARGILTLSPSNKFYLHFPHTQYSWNLKNLFWVVHGLADEWQKSLFLWQILSVNLNVRGLFFSLSASTQNTILQYIPVSYGHLVKPLN